MSKSPTLLIIDDDLQLVDMLEELLLLEGFKVITAASGEAGLRELNREDHIDAIVLDVMMPGIDGFETLRRIRVKSQLPVIMLTARGDADDRILGLEQGADDYLAKPFRPRELLLRLKVILQRGQRQPSETTLKFHDIMLDTTNLHATLGGEPLSLTGAEIKILQALLEEPGAVRSRDTLTERALGRSASPYDRALDTHISNLRSKLGSKTTGVVIKSVRGAGYTIIHHGEPSTS